MGFALFSPDVSADDLEVVVHGWGTVVVPESALIIGEDRLNLKFNLVLDKPLDSSIKAIDYLDLELRVRSTQQSLLHKTYTVTVDGHSLKVGAVFTMDLSWDIISGALPIVIRPN